MSHLSTNKRDDCTPPSTSFLAVGQIEPPRGTGPLIYNENETYWKQAAVFTSNLKLYGINIKPD
jgi:hypothetical protein